MTTTNIQVTNVFRRQCAAETPTIVHKGGSGSAKSYSLCQFFIFERLLKYKGYRGLITRKTRHSLKLSTYQMFISILKDTGIYNERHHNKSDLIYEVPSMKSYVCFAGMDNRERMKSTEWHDIWMEEANEFEKEDYTFLKTRKFRGILTPGFKPRIIISYNPVMCWVQKIEKLKGVTLIHSTYKDNPFVNEEYKQTLEGLKDEDDDYYKIYALGEDAEAKHIIYKPYTMVQVIPSDECMHDVFYGLDFGFNKPTALIKIGERDEGLYLTELLYRTHLTNPEKIALMKELIPEQFRHREIWGDCEDPNAIAEIQAAGFNVIPAVKGPGSVKAGIDFCKRKKFYSCTENVNLNEERAGYKWRVDKQGNVLDEPVKFKDHAMDAKRYAVHGHYVGQGEPGTVKQALKEVQDAPDCAAAHNDW